MANQASGPALPPRQRQTSTATRPPVTTPDQRACFMWLQAVEDAISYRLARLAAPCPGCGPQQCDDHAVDAGLIAGYRDTARQLSQALHPRR